MIDWESIVIGVLTGMMIGRLWAGWMVWHYLKSKRPDEIGHRTGLWMSGRMYYIVTEREYVEKVMGQ